MAQARRVAFDADCPVSEKERKPSAFSVCINDRAALLGDTPVAVKTRIKRDIATARAKLGDPPFITWR